MPLDTSARDRLFCDILNRELVCALGCTEPIAVAYAAALARETLGAEPERMQVGCSGNIIKNVKSVTVPNSGGMRGIEAAAILGAVGGDPTSSLEVLESVGEDDLARCRELLQTPGMCEVTLEQGVPNLYIKVVAEADGHTAEVVIANHHTNVVLRALDGEELQGSHAAVQGCMDAKTSAHEQDELLSLDAIMDFARTGDISAAREALERQISLNSAISDEGLMQPWGAQVGKTLLASRGEDVACRARARAAAGSDARMNGCSMPVVIVCGSGNQGITACMPVVEYARKFGVPHEGLLRALALSDLVAVHVKSYIGALSAFCGVVCAACGAGAAITWMAGGTAEQVGATVVNTLANVGGIVCDGAKSSCAAKISAAVDAAILGHDMAMVGRSFHAGEGLVQQTVEETIASMGYVGRVGMQPTDVEILNIMIGKTRV
ncbi:hypothetical protein B5F33_06215 [Collinsella sp. An2]|nr:hypothetical protein B5F33_06215 [Collinsella sp. An2]